jgi:hypothetical protein
MKIRRITLSPAELGKLSAEERNLFFLVGHINNEVSSLYKTFSWCLAAAHVPGATDIEGNAANAQGMIYARLLAGKLLEAWGALAKSWFASKLGVDIAKTLHPAALTSLDELKRYFGSKNLIFAVRNSFAFHYHAATLGAAWERASQEPFFELVIGVNRGNSFNQAAELVANVAVFHTIAPDDAHAGMATFFEELDHVAGHFQNYCEGVTRAVLERLSGMNLDQLGSLSEIEPTRKYSEVFIPVFIEPEESIDGLLP